MTDMEESGAISPRGRFERMEAALQRIEDKLDSKAEAAELAAIEARLQVIEDTGSAEAREALKIARHNEARLDDIESGRSTSPITQGYLTRFERMEMAVSQMQSSAREHEAVQRATVETNAARYRVFLWVVGIVTAVNFTLSTVIGAINIVNLIGGR